MKPLVTILEETAQYFSTARVNLIAGAANLHKIREEELWKSEYESFSEYLEDIQVSQGMASKLISTYQFYVLENNITQAKLVGIDHEKLYLALKLPGTAEKKLTSAMTLSRQELRQEVADPNDECPHDETIKICASCHKRV